jgi:malate synthase
MPPLTYTAADAEALTHTDNATRSIRGARDLISVAMQYANAFGQGMQAAALKPADSFGNDDVLYLMEDMATAEIRVSILWEWLHKRASLATSDSPADTAVPFTSELFERLLAEEYGKLVSASDRDVHDDSKRTTLPIAKLLVDACVTSAGKLPWFVDLLNATLGVHDLAEAATRIESLRHTFLTQRVRVTQNLDFDRDRLSAAPH